MREIEPVPEMLIGDPERNAELERAREAHALGYIRTTEDLNARISRIMNSNTAKELKKILADVPASVGAKKPESVKEPEDSFLEKLFDFPPFWVAGIVFGLATAFVPGIMLLGEAAHNQHSPTPGAWALSLVAFIAGWVITIASGVMLADL